jgi:hypothetical protein
MDGARFAKLVRECRLISKGFTSTRADLVFASIKQAVSASSQAALVCMWCLCMNPRTEHSL